MPQSISENLVAHDGPVSSRCLSRLSPSILTYQVVTALLRRGADPTTKDGLGRTAAMCAVMAGRVGALREVGRRSTEGIRRNISPHSTRISGVWGVHSIFRVSVLLYTPWRVYLLTVFSFGFVSAAEGGKSWGSKKQDQGAAGAVGAQPGGDQRGARSMPSGYH